MNVNAGRMPSSGVEANQTLQERQALPVLQGHLGASRASCLRQSEDVENQRGIVGHSLARDGSGGAMGAA